MKFKRIFLIILDSLGVGESPDADKFNDKGANTLKHIQENRELFVPNLKKLGFLNTINMDENLNVDAYYTIAKPINVGKDSLSGHYELTGIHDEVAFKTFMNKGFPIELVEAIEQVTGKRVIGNKCDDTESIINELGERHLNYGSLILYTTRDSNLNIAAHEDVIPVSHLYHYCEKIRQITLREEWKVGRVSARPFAGTPGNFKEIKGERKDYAIKPPHRSLLNNLKDHEYSVIAVGKVSDLFDSEGISKNLKAINNSEAINKINDIMDKDFTGLCIANLSDFDYYGHKRNLEGYASSIEDLDVEIPMMLNKLNKEDLLIFTADHGCDPAFSGSDHTRENVPVIIFSRAFKEPKRLEPLNTLADIGATIAENFAVEPLEIGTSLLEKLQ